MYRILSFFAITTIFACISPAYTTKHGIKVYDSTVERMPTVEETEVVVDYAVKHLSMSSVVGEAKVMYVNVWQYRMVDGYGTIVELADGYTDINTLEIIISVFQDCLADSGLIHELAHVIHDYNARIYDGEHSDMEFWRKVKQIEENAIDDLCPADYIRRDIPPNYKPTGTK
jgi:hypothetical protein